MTLIQLIYVSAASAEYGPAELEDILDASVRNNPRAGLTGMLLYAAGSFMQVLEGDEAEVERRFAVISKDPRHHSMIVLEREPIRARSFSAWNMGFKQLGDRESAAHPGYAPFFARGFDVASIGATPGLALAMLKTFADQQRG